MTSFNLLIRFGLPTFNLIGFVAFIVLVVLPAYFINKYLLAWLKPKQSIKNFVLYVLAAFSAAIIYTFLFCLVLIKFVYPIN